jgi:multiple sugar transport system permease protein
MTEPQARSLVSSAQLNRHQVTYRVILTLVVVIFTLIFIGPLYFLFTDGLKSTSEAVQVPPTIIPAHVHPGTYTSARWRSSWSSTWPPPTRCPGCARCSATSSSR